ncbi:MAG: hypothetical protein RIF39_17505, partial [Cyclobacteriaceae bacterium]
VQLNYDQLARLGDKVDKLSIILKTSIAEWKDIKVHLSTYNIAYLVLAVSTTPEWNVVGEINSVINVLIPQHLVENMSKVESLPITGILMEGSSEDKPGQKDYDHLANVLETLEVD